MPKQKYKETKGVMKILNTIAKMLVLVGGLNWGAFALGYNLIGMLIGVNFILKIIYGAVGLGTLWLIVEWIYCKLTNK